MKTKKVNSFFALALALALSGCGGGGSAASSGGGDSNFLNSAFSDATPDDVQDDLSAIIDSKATQGSVSQSTNIDTGSGNATRDQLHVNVSGDPASPAYEILYNNVIGGPTATINISADSSDVSYSTDTNVAGVTLQKVVIGGNSGQRFDLNADGTLDGRVYLDLYTDYKSDGDTDYVSGGIWLYIPDTYSAATSPYSMGAFADGNQEFTNISSLSGTVRYEGRAAGFYSIITASEATVERTYSDVELTADFDANTISGSLTDIGTFYGIQIDSINLEEANIEANGFFNDGEISTDVQVGGVNINLEGHWGGQFYGEDAEPSAVAGTVGGGTTLGGVDFNFVAAFGAYTEE